MDGPASPSAVTKDRVAQPELDFVTSVADWTDPDYAVCFYRSSYGAGFRLTVTSRRLDGLARTAAAEAVRLDAREAPLREMARQKAEADTTRASQQKARLANKAVFKP